MAWIICPNEICGERFALSDDTEAFARAHEGLRLVCPFGHAIWPLPLSSEPEKTAAEPEKPKARAKRVLPVTEAEHVALEEPEEVLPASPEAVIAEAKEAAELVGLTPLADATAAESQGASEEPASSASEGGTATEVGSEATTADTGRKEPDGQDADPVDAVEPGEPNENEIYMLVGDDWIFDPRRTEDRRTTYKNGEIFSDAGRDKGYKIYEDHAKAEEAVGEEAAELPAELQTLIAATETVESWPEVKDAMGAFQKGTLWPTLNLDQQNHVRASAWDTLVERAPPWLPDHAHDLSAFRLWVEAQTDPSLIRADLALLQADPAAQAKTSALQSVTDAAQARINTVS